ncbi:MAG: 5-formyltetrahydrofolate cyclo-ligase [Alphaproteobacteria bacterium]|nr:5-formyltetrahydrofolate cyclo-ligase [Alphaproteobacteria bacterium]
MPATPRARSAGTLAAEKVALRAAARRRRAAIPAAAAARAAAAVAAILRDRVPIPAAAAVAGYWPLGDEFDPRPAMTALEGRGHRLALPVVAGPGLPLVFRAWQRGDPLEASAFGTSVPLGDAPEIAPGAVLAPALAVDDRGYRLGYGGGYYDRTLARLRAGAGARPLAIAVCFARQMVDAVPHGDGDQPVDWVVTEDGAMRIS